MILKKGEEEVVEKLLQENDEFRKLYDEHRDLEGKIDNLKSQRHISEEDRAQMSNLKKVKLQGKDRMAEIIRSSENG